MTKIRGWYRGDDGQMHEMEGACNEQGVITFPHVPSGGIRIEGVDMSTQISAQAGNVNFEAMLDSLKDLAISTECGTDHVRDNQLYDDQRQALLDYVRRLESALRASLVSLEDISAIEWEETVTDVRRTIRKALETGEG
jgi:hypothetical protein